MSLGAQVWRLLEKELTAALIDAAARDEKIRAAQGALPSDLLMELDAVLQSGRASYRDGMLVQLAYKSLAPDIDATVRQPGARSVATTLGSFLSANHIEAVKDAFQNIGKNSRILNRGNLPEFDRFLQILNTSAPDNFEHALRYLTCRIADTARPVLPMPELDRTRLIFSRVTRLLRVLLDKPSGGAYQQFAVAAVLDVMVRSTAGAARRVETKNLNASDRSAFAAGDVQIATGGRVLDAFEVTANDWRTKISGSEKIIRENDLSRLHIIASRRDQNAESWLGELDALREDASVLDVVQFLDVIVALLTRAERAEALIRLYELLDRKQSSAETVNDFVKLLEEQGLVYSSGD